MDRSYVRLMAVSGYQSLKIDDIHNAMTSPIFQKQSSALRHSVNKDKSLSELYMCSGTQSSYKCPVSDVPGHDQLITPRTPTYSSSYNSSMQTPQTHRQMTIWMYTNPNTLYMLPCLNKSNMVNKLDEFIQSKGLASDAYIVANLAPKASYPVPIMHFSPSNHLDNGVILCLPTQSITLTIQPLRCGGSFNATVSPLQTIGDLKHVISKLKGYPSNRQELLYNNIALQNHDQLLNHQLRTDVKLQLVLQPARPFTVVVETFWGHVYYLDIDSCMTTDQLLLNVLSNTSNSKLARDEIKTKLPTLRSLFQLQYKKHVLHSDFCLNYYDICSGSIIRLRTTSEVYHDDKHKLRVIEDEEELLVATGASYDTWFLIALQAHGKLHTPIDMFSLYVNDQQTYLYDELSTIQLPDNYMHVRIIPEKDSAHHDKYDLHFIEVHLPTGRMHSIRCHGQDLISKVKDRIGQSGLLNVNFYELIYKKVRLPSSSKIMDYKLPEHVEMELKLFTFPVYVSQANTMTTVNVDMACPISVLVKRITDKLGCTPIKSALVHSGKDLYSIKSSLPRHVGLFIHSTIYVEPTQPTKVIHVVTESEVLPLPVRPTLDPLHLKQLFLTCYDAQTFLQAFQWFIRWRFLDNPGFQVGRMRSSSQKKLESAHSLHTTLQVARDKLKPSSNTTATSQSGADQILSKFLDSLPTVQYSPKKNQGNTKLPLISRSLHCNTGASTSQSTHNRTIQPGAYTIDNQNSSTKRSVRFDIPDKSHIKSKKKDGSSSLGLVRSNAIWQDGKHYLQRQARQNIHNPRGHGSMTSTTSHTSIPRTPRTGRTTHPNNQIVQSTAAPKWHQSKAHMNPNFTNNISSTNLSVTPVKSAVQTMSI